MVTDLEEWEITLPISTHIFFYRTRVRSLFTLVTNSLTHSLTHSCEDTNSKLFDVVTVAAVDDEDRVGNSLLQISKPRFGFVEVVKLNLGQYSEARFGQDFEAYDLWRG